MTITHTLLCSHSPVCDSSACLSCLLCLFACSVSHDKTVLFNFTTLEFGWCCLYDFLFLFCHFDWLLSRLLSLSSIEDHWTAINQKGKSNWIQLRHADCHHERYFVIQRSKAAAENVTFSRVEQKNAFMLPFMCKQWFHALQIGENGLETSRNPENIYIMLKLSSSIVSEGPERRYDEI